MICVLGTASIFLDGPFVSIDTLFVKSTMFSVSHMV
jgi:hypothetical protein